MAYLYLNFLDNLDKGLGDKAWGRNDFFTQSLNEQYKTLKIKLGYAPDALQEFIGYIRAGDTREFGFADRRRGGYI